MYSRQAIERTIGLENSGKVEESGSSRTLCARPNHWPDPKDTKKDEDKTINKSEKNKYHLPENCIVCSLHCRAKSFNKTGQLHQDSQQQKGGQQLPCGQRPHGVQQNWSTKPRWPRHQEGQQHQGGQQHHDGQQHQAGLQHEGGEKHQDVR